MAAPTVDSVGGLPRTSGAGLDRTSGVALDRAFRWLCLAAGMLVLVILALIVISTTNKAWPAFRHEGLSFITSKDWNPPAGHFGALAFIYGTVIISVIALAVGVPLSIGIALFINELVPGRLRKVFISVLDLLAAIPSVVYGLWGLQVLVLSGRLTTFYGWIHDAFGWIPLVGKLFGEPISGKSFMTAGLILALMIVPIMTSLIREVFRTVPQGQRDGALALGATRFEMINAVVFPYSRRGMIGAVMLGLGRALGETIAAALVIGSSPQITERLFGSGDAMAAYIANQFSEASGDFRAALIGLGVVLFLLTVLINIAGRALAGKPQGASR
jgi:phosphate transport system permease protein